MKKIIIFILLLYFLALAQTSFFSHFRFFNVIPSLVLLAVLLINVLEKPRDRSGIFAAFAGGFFIDVFSSGFIGLYVLILAASAFLIKLILKDYVWA